jgi:hypothetical protein
MTAASVPDGSQSIVPGYIKEIYRDGMKPDRRLDVLTASL